MKAHNNRLQNQVSQLEQSLIENERTNQAQQVLVNFLKSSLIDQSATQSMNSKNLKYVIREANKMRENLLDVISEINEESP